MIGNRCVSVLASLLAWTVGSWACAAEPPMGSADFVPTPDRPVGFRGDGSGIYPGATPPTEFSNTKNLLWVTKIPVVEKPGGWSHSPPMVVGKRVFVSAEPDSTLCLDADTGKILWRDALGLLQTNTECLAMHSGNDFSTASSDGKAIYRLFSGKPKDKGGGSILVSYDLDGKRRWLTTMTDPRSGRPLSTDNLRSPLLIANRLLVVVRDSRAGDVIAYDPATGQVAWGPAPYDKEPVEGKPWGHGTDGGLVAIRLGGKPVALAPGGLCIDPQTGKLLARTLLTQDARGRKYNRLGFGIGAIWSVYNTPVARANSDGSATVVFSGSDKKTFEAGEAKDDLTPVPPETDLSQAPWPDKKLAGGIRVLACRLSLDAAGAIRSEPLWGQPASLVVRESGQLHPHVSLAGDRIMLLHVKGQMGVVDLKTGRLCGKDFQPAYRCEYKTAHVRYDLKAPEVIAGMAEYELDPRDVFGGKGDQSFARMGRTVYARTAVDSRGYIYLANRMHDVFVLELTDSGFRQIAKNVVHLPVCFYSHADPVFHGSRLYYRTWGHLYCFEGSATGRGATGRPNPTLPQLLEALCHPNASVRDEAAKAIGQAGKAAVPGLVKLLGRRDINVFVLRSVADALGRIGPQACAQAVPGLVRTLRAEVAQARERYDKLPSAIRDSRLRRAVRGSESVRALGRAGAAAAQPVACCLDGADDVMQRFVRSVLDRLGPDANRTAKAIESRRSK